MALQPGRSRRAPGAHTPPPFRLMGAPTELTNGGAGGRAVGGRRSRCAGPLALAARSSIGSSGDAQCAQAGGAGGVGVLRVVGDRVTGSSKRPSLWERLQRPRRPRIPDSGRWHAVLCGEVPHSPDHPRGNMGSRLPEVQSLRLARLHLLLDPQRGSQAPALPAGQSQVQLRLRLLTPRPTFTRSDFSALARRRLRSS